MGAGEPRGQRSVVRRANPTPAPAIPSLVPDEDPLPPIERIRWLDALHDESQGKVDAIDDICPITTIGYVVRETPWAVTLASEYVGDGEYRMWGVIPVCLIVERQRLT